LAFVGQINSAVYTSTDSSYELSRSIRCIVRAADFDVSLIGFHRLKPADVAGLSKRTESHLIFLLSRIATH
jgi:hypothetical protein